MTLVQSEQSRDIRLTQLVKGPFICRLASYRKAEDAKRNLLNEDYLVADLKANLALFALCDGVGASFHGNIGSQILGEKLIYWLRRLSLPKVDNVQDYGQWLDDSLGDLRNELGRLTQLATEIVNNRPLKAKEGLVRIAEEDQRKTFGSQSNFVAGIIWPRSPEIPNGLVVFFWLGNARIRIFNGSNDITESLGWGIDPEQDREVWSSKDGVIGHVYSSLQELSSITTIIAYTDGFESVEKQVRPDLGAAELESLINQAQSIKDDDATYIEIAFSDFYNPRLADDLGGFLQEKYRINASRTVPAKLPDEVPGESNKPKVPVKKKRKVKRVWKLILWLVLGFFLISAGFFLGLAFANWQITSSNQTPTALPATSITPSPFVSPTPQIILPSPPVDQVNPAAPNEGASPTATIESPIQNTPFPLSGSPGIP